MEDIQAYLLGAEFRTKSTDADKYLALLAWTAARHAAEFREFILALSSGAAGHRYLGMSREQIADRLARNQARPIPGTRYWAVMNIDAATKRRFLSRILDFIGYREELVDLACGAIGVRGAPRRRRQPAPSGT
jgi:negative modulator of initiation of replication